MLDPETIEEIDRLKREKPEHWKEKIRAIILRWHKDEGGFDREQVSPGPSDQLGRRIHRTDGCPIFDPMDDESEP